MKDYDELLNEFESIPELHVSEELLGAYIEGKLDFYEASSISELISKEQDLSDIVKNIDTPCFYDTYDDFSQAAMYVSDLDLPSIPTPQSSLISNMEAYLKGFEEEINDIYTSPDDKFFNENNSHQDDRIMVNSSSIDIDSSNDDEMFNDEEIDY